MLVYLIYTPMTPLSRRRRPRRRVEGISTEVALHVSRPRTSRLSSAPRAFRLPRHPLSRNMATGTTRHVNAYELCRSLGPLSLGSGQPLRRAQSVI